MNRISPDRVHTRLELIGLASGLGAPDPRCADGPAALRTHGLGGRLADAGIAAGWQDDVVPAADEHLPLARRVADVCFRLAGRVEDAAAAGRRFAVIGGDHSSAAGTWAGAANALGEIGGGKGARPGLIWIDAHMDSHTPETTPSGQWHGMPLAALLGHGHDGLTGIARHGPALDPARLCLIGARSFEREEPELLGRLGVRVFAMPEVEARGLAAVMAEALAIAGGNGAPFGVSFDLDALDPVHVPGTGLPVDGGLDVRALVSALRPVGRQANFIGCEIVEYNPHLDVDGATAPIVGDALAALFGH